MDKIRYEIILRFEDCGDWSESAKEDCLSDATFWFELLQTYLPSDFVSSTPGIGYFDFFNIRVIIDVDGSVPSEVVVDAVGEAERKMSGLKDTIIFKL